MAANKPAAQPVVLVVHGPNLNLLGEREPEIYGHGSLAALDASLQELGVELGVEVRTAQANGEGQIIDLIHQAARDCAAIVLNPGGYTHTSVAIGDAIRAVPIPVVEVHLSNLYAREPQRHVSLTGQACAGVIMGLGRDSYHLAVRQLAAMIRFTA